MGDNAKQELYNFVKALRAHFKLRFCEYPVDTVKICKSNPAVELVYRDFKTRGMCGTALIGEKSNTIILNSRRNAAECNFDCGHEIIHCTKHCNKDVKLFNCFETTLQEQDRFLEWEANEGSAELLVPYKMILPILLRNRDILHSPSRMGKLRADMARDFAVPNATIFYRLESLKYEIEQHLDGIPLNEIVLLSDNAQKQSGITVLSLNDFRVRKKSATKSMGIY